MQEIRVVCSKLLIRLAPILLAPHWVCRSTGHFIFILYHKIQFAYGYSDNQNAQENQSGQVPGKVPRRINKGEADGQATDLPGDILQRDRHCAT